VAALDWSGQRTHIGNTTTVTTTNAELLRCSSLFVNHLKPTNKLLLTTLYSLV